MSSRNLALTLVVLAVCETAVHAQIVLVSQDRGIALSVQAFDPNGTPPPTTLVVTAPDAAPFTVDQSVQTATSHGSGFARATHASTLAADRITGSGAGFTNASSLFDPSAWGNASADATMTIVFDVAAPTAYSITGSMSFASATAGATPYVYLNSASGLVFTFFGNGTFGTTPVQHAGVLAPGRYTFGAGADSDSSATAFWYLNDRSNFEFDLVFDALEITPYCFGDGTGTHCPCGNSSAPGDEVGCLSSIGVGGKLRATGIPSIAGDTLVLQGSQMTNGSALYFQGTLQDNGGNGSAFGDGKRCAAGTIARLGTRTNSGGSSQYPIGGEQSVSLRGSVSTPGTRVYQVWYRNVATFCAPQGFNLTNGLQVVWVL